MPIRARTVKAEKQLDDGVGRFLVLRSVRTSGIHYFLSARPIQKHNWDALQRVAHLGFVGAKRGPQSEEPLTTPLHSLSRCKGDCAMPSFTGPARKNVKANSSLLRRTHGSGTGRAKYTIPAERGFLGGSKVTLGPPACGYRVHQLRTAMGFGLSSKNSHHGLTQLRHVCKQIFQGSTPRA